MERIHRDNISRTKIYAEEIHSEEINPCVIADATFPSQFLFLRCSQLDRASCKLAFFAQKPDNQFQILQWSLSRRPGATNFDAVAIIGNKIHLTIRLNAKV